MLQSQNDSSDLSCKVVRVCCNIGVRRCKEEHGADADDDDGRVL